MQIKVDLKIFFVLFIFFLTNQINTYLVFMLFAIIHELAHLLIGIMLEFKPKKINIISMGLSVSFYIEEENYIKNIKMAKIITLKKLIVSLAGPISNFAIAILFIIFKFDLVEETRRIIIYSNLVIGFFNLLPIYPLDGGRIIKCIIHICKGLKKSYKYTNLISNINLIIITAISSLAILYFKNIAIFFIVIYLWVLVMKENIVYNRKMKLYKALDRIA